MLFLVNSQINCIFFLFSAVFTVYGRNISVLDKKPDTPKSASGCNQMDLVHSVISRPGSIQTN